MSEIQREPDELPAPADEVSEAVEGLTRPELLRLRQYAWFRHWGMGSRAAGRSPHDLLSDALIAVLEGRRKWRRSQVDIFTLLQGTIRSLSSHIRDGRPVDAFDDLVPLGSTDEDSQDPIEALPSTTASVHDELEKRELDRQIRDRFDDDPEVLLVYESFCQKLSPTEIRECLGLSVKEYDAAAKRLRRAVKRMVEGGRP